MRPSGANGSSYLSPYKPYGLVKVEVTPRSSPFLRSAIINAVFEFSLVPSGCGTATIILQPILDYSPAVVASIIIETDDFSFTDGIFDGI